MGLGITTKRFSKDIEELVKSKRLTYIEAIVYFCEQKDIEPERVARFIDKGMKEKIQVDAEALNFLPKTNKLSGL